jgi:hypothetical protein
MSHTDPGQPDLAALRAAAVGAEFTQAESGLVGTCGCPLRGADPLARGVARSLAEAGLTVHRCARRDPMYRLGGVCLLPVPAEPGTGRGGVAVSWTTHDLLLRDQYRYGTCRETRQVMNAALGRVLRAFGYRVTKSGSGRAWLVTSHPRGTEAGR